FFQPIIFSEKKPTLPPGGAVCHPCHTYVFKHNFLLWRGASFPVAPIVLIVLPDIEQFVAMESLQILTFGLIIGIVSGPLLGGAQLFVLYKYVSWQGGMWWILANGISITLSFFAFLIISGPNLINMIVLIMGTALIYGCVTGFTLTRVVGRYKPIPLSI
ncbi:MAG: hypothetical protein AAF485_15570, partial [Chloroflexota bacterium]